MRTRHRHVLAGSVVAALVIALSGCAGLVNLVVGSQSRDDDLDALVTTIEAIDGVASVDLEYEGLTTQRRDAASGTISLTQDADAAAVLDAVRTEYVAALPGAGPLEVTIEDDLSTVLQAFLDEDGPDLALLQSAVAAATELSASTQESFVQVHQDFTLATARSDDASAVAVVAEARRLSEALAQHGLSSITVYGGSEQLVAPQQAQSIGDGSELTVASPLGDDEQVVSATETFLEAEPTAAIDVSLADGCHGYLAIVPADGETDADALDRVAPLADAWLSASQATCEDRLEVHAGTEVLTP